MNTHTPGPWQVDDTGGNIYGATGDVVASVHGFPKPHLTGEGAENGWLIAAAPTMLEVLQTTRKNISSIKACHSDCNTYDVWLEVVDAAIAKATGGKP